MSQKTSILFVCLGNICRSPMAQTIFEKRIEEQGLSHLFEVDSAGLIGYHEGNRADSRMRAHAERHGYHITHRSRPVILSDFDKFDYIIGMDEQNIRALRNMAKSDEHHAKIVQMTDYLQQIEADEVPDPYYGGAEGFEYVIELLEDANNGLLKSLIK